MLLSLRGLVVQNYLEDERGSTQTSFFFESETYMMYKLRIAKLNMCNIQAFVMLSDTVFIYIVFIFTYMYIRNEKHRKTLLLYKNYISSQLNK